jgi:hypothetical protein
MNRTAHRTSHTGTADRHIRKISTSAADQPHLGWHELRGNPTDSRNQPRRQAIFLGE